MKFKLVRDFDSMTIKQRRIVAFGSLPLGIAMIFAFEGMAGVPPPVTIRNVILLCLLSWLTALVVRFLRERGIIDLWQK